MQEINRPCVGLRCGTWERFENGKTSKLVLAIELGRPFTMLAAFLVGLLLAAILDAGLAGLFLAVFLAAGQGFGQTVNQIADIEIDKINKPYRPLPSGRLTKEEAWAYALLYYVVGLFSASMLGVRGLISYMLLIFFAFFYSVEPLRMKTSGAWSSLLWQAVSRGLLPPLVAAWIFGTYSIWPLGVLAFVWVLALQGTKDYNDVLGDLLHNIETLPTRYGIGGARKIMSFMVSLYIIFLAFLIATNLAPLLLLAQIPVAFTALYGISIVSPSENNIGWNAYYLGLATHYLLWFLA